MVIETAQDQRLSLEARTAKIKQLWDGVVAKESADMKAVQSTQQAFAQQHNMRIVPSFQR